MKMTHIDENFAHWRRQINRRHYHRKKEYSNKSGGEKKTQEQTLTNSGLSNEDEGAACSGSGSGNMNV